MAFTEGQIAGSVVALATATLIYLFSLFYPLFHEQNRPRPFLPKPPSSITIELSGSGVLNPGIYFVPAGTTITDFLEKVERGLSPDITGRISTKLSRTKLSTGDSLLVLRNKDGPLQYVLGEMQAARKIALGLRVNINRASYDDLLLIPGVGTKTSAQIISFRKTSGRIHDLDQLMDIKGIKKKRLGMLKKYLSVDEPQRK